MINYGINTIIKKNAFQLKLWIHQENYWIFLIYFMINELIFLESMTFFLCDIFPIAIFFVSKTCLFFQLDRRHSFCVCFFPRDKGDQSILSQFLHIYMFTDNSLKLGLYIQRELFKQKTSFNTKPELFECKAYLLNI